MTLREVAAKTALLAGGCLAGGFTAELVLFCLDSPPAMVSSVANPPYLRKQVRSDEFEYVEESNGQGLRYRDVPLRKPPGTARVFVVGDSYVKGDGVQVGERFTDLLERRFTGPGRPVELVNGGLSGGGPMAYARLFRFVGLRYEPDGLLLCINANDAADVKPNHSPAAVDAGTVPPRGGLSRALQPVWPRLVTRVQMAVHQRELQQTHEREDYFHRELFAALAAREGVSDERIAAWKARLPEAWERAGEQGRLASYVLYLALVRPDYLTTAIDLAGEPGDRQWQIEARLLTHLVRTARASGVPVAAVFLPNAYLFDPAAASGQPPEPFPFLGGTVRPEWATTETEVQRRLRRWAEGEGIPFLDLTAALREARRGAGPLHFTLDGHWNSQGHKAAASAIARWLEESRALPALVPAEDR